MHAPPAATYAPLQPCMHPWQPCTLPPPLWTEWQTGVKILPCPKLRLREVTMLPYMEIKPPHGAEAAICFHRNLNIKTMQFLIGQCAEAIHDNHKLAARTLTGRINSTSDPDFLYVPLVKEKLECKTLGRFNIEYWISIHWEDSMWNTESQDTGRVQR